MRTFCLFAIVITLIISPLFTFSQDKAANTEPQQNATMGSGMIMGSLGPDPVPKEDLELPEYVELLDVHGDRVVFHSVDHYAIFTNLSVKPEQYEIQFFKKDKMIVEDVHLEGGPLSKAVFSPDGSKLITSQLIMPSGFISKTIDYLFGPNPKTSIYIFDTNSGKSILNKTVNFIVSDISWLDNQSIYIVNQPIEDTKNNVIYSFDVTNGSLSEIKKVDQGKYPQILPGKDKLYTIIFTDPMIHVLSGFIQEYDLETKETKKIYEWSKMHHENFIMSPSNDKITFFTVDNTTGKITHHVLDLETEKTSTIDNMYGNLYDWIDNDTFITKKQLYLETNRFSHEDNYLAVKINN